MIFHLDKSFSHDGIVILLWLFLLKNTHLFEVIGHPRIVCGVNTLNSLLLLRAQSAKYCNSHIGYLSEFLMEG